MLITHHHLVVPGTYGMTDYEKNNLTLDKLVDEKDKRQKYQEETGRKISTKAVNAYIKAREKLREEVGDIKECLDAAEAKTKAIEAVKKALDAGYELDDIEEAILLSKLKGD